MTQEIIEAAQDAEKIYAVGDGPTRQLTIGSLYLFYKPKNQPSTSDPTHFIDDLRSTFEAGTINTTDADNTTALLTQAWQSKMLVNPGLEGSDAPKQHVFVGVMKALDILDQRVELTAQPA